MIKSTRNRFLMALIGAAAGISLYLLGNEIGHDTFPERAVFALFAFAASFFTAWLAIAGPLKITRAALGALAVAVVVAVLFTWAGFRFATMMRFLDTLLPILMAAVLTMIPLPFLIAAAGPGWRDYPTLFQQAWSIFVRLSLAWVFVAVFWAVILLSSTLLNLVGVTVIEDLLEHEVMPFVITGSVLGLALAVVNELSDYVSPFLVLRLLRLLLPVVLVVLVVFLVAVPLHGLSGLFGHFSAAATLIAMVAAGATLVTAAIDQSDEEATATVWMRRAAQALAVVLLLPAALALWAIWLRVAQYGWTPGRVFAALTAFLAMGYGVSYALAVLRGPGWMARIRRANVGMALVLIAAAALWLTPVLNPERISANGQMARFEAAKRDPATLDLHALGKWGKSGAETRESLARIAAEPGNEALARLLAAGPEVNSGQDLPVEAMLAQLVQIMPLQPVTATATRDMLMAQAEDYLLAEWLRACNNRLPGGGAGCLMVVADFYPAHPGEEALMMTRSVPNFLSFAVLNLGDDGLQSHGVWMVAGNLPQYGAGDAFLAAAQTTPGALSPAPINQLSIGGIALIPGQ